MMPLRGFKELNKEEQDFVLEGLDEKLHRNYDKKFEKDRRIIIEEVALRLHYDDVLNPYVTELLNPTNLMKLFNESYYDYLKKMREEDQK